MESNPNLFAIVVSAHLKALELAHDDEARRVSHVRLVKGLYVRGLGAEKIRQLYRLIDGLLNLPKQLAELAWGEIQDFEKEKGMPYITTAERVGLEKGLAQGREEGLMKGIKVALELKFAARGLALLPEIRRIEDAEVLDKVLHAIQSAESPEALRDVWEKS